MELNLLNISLLLSSGLGLFLSVLIFNKYGYSLANRLLAILLLLYSVILLRLLLWDLEYYKVIPHILILPMSIALVMGPIHYLYSKYLINSNNNFDKKDWLHFIPAIIYQAILFQTLFISNEELIKSIQADQIKSVSKEFILFNWIITIHVLIYVALTLRGILKHSKSIKQVFSSVEKIKLNWLLYITVFIGAGIVIFLIENTFLLGGYIISKYFALSNLIFCIYVIVIGYLGLLKSEIFSNPEYSDQVHELPELFEAQDSKANTRYKHSGLTDERAKEILKNLLDLMNNEHPYRDNSLTLNKLAEKLSVSPHNLSEVINTGLNQNFYDFINSYRVERVKKSIQDKSNENLTLLALSIDAGFNSKSSFNAIFKKVTGITPSEYRSKNIN